MESLISSVVIEILGFRPKKSNLNDRIMMATASKINKSKSLKVKKCIYILLYYSTIPSKFNFTTTFI